MVYTEGGRRRWMEDADDDEVSQIFPSKDLSAVLNDCAANLMSVSKFSNEVSVLFCIPLI